MYLDMAKEGRVVETHRLDDKKVVILGRNFPVSLASMPPDRPCPHGHSVPARPDLVPSSPRTTPRARASTAPWCTGRTARYVPSLNEPAGRMGRGASARLRSWERKPSVPPLAASGT